MIDTILEGVAESAGHHFQADHGSTHGDADQKFGKYDTFCTICRVLFAGRLFNQFSQTLYI